MFIVVSRIAPAKSDVSLSKRDQAMVGDGYAMGVAAQILEHIFGATEGRFQMDDPVIAVQRAEPRSEGFRLSEESEVSVEVELA